MTRALIFPGQGSHYIGMGQEFYNNFKTARETLNTIKKTIGFDIEKIMFEGPEETLTSTNIAQPAIMAVSLMIFRTLVRKLDLSSTKELAQYVAGHSLGEYSALCASGVISIEDTAKLLKIRGNAMKNATKNISTTMAACIDIELTQLKKTIDSVLTDASDYVCDIANDNSESQIVISGDSKSISKIVNHLKSCNYKALLLKVGGAFHSKFMLPAQITMQQAISEINFNTPQIPIILNTTAHEETKVNVIKTNLIKQICSTVRWREIINRLRELNVDEIIEIGPKKTLSRILLKSNQGKFFKICNISSIDDLERFTL